MSANAIQEAIFKAVDIIIEKRLKTLKMNYCVEGIVDSEAEYDDKNDLYYWVNYQDIRIKAYPISEIHSRKNELDIIDSSIGSNYNVDLVNISPYSKGDLVYTLVINGDLNKRRLILCRV